MSSRQRSSGMFVLAPLQRHLLTTCMCCSIMKARKTMKNQALIQEVIQQISQRFAPKLPDIKKVRWLEHFEISTGP